MTADDVVDVGITVDVEQLSDGFLESPLRGWRVSRCVSAGLLSSTVVSAVLGQT